MTTLGQSSILFSTEKLVWLRGYVEKDMVLSLQAGNQSGDARKECG